MNRCMNHCTLVFASLFFPAFLGRSEAPRKCLPPVGSCKECGKQLEWTQGLFSANYWVRCGPWSPCMSAWCARCYTSRNELGFFIAESPENYADPDYEMAMDAKWRRKQNTRSELYLVAHWGDHLMLSFECDLCIFQKLLYKHQPDPQSQVDTCLMLTIWRINLDALCSRATSTIVCNAGVVARGLRHSAYLGLTGPYLETVPLPYHDHCGYEVALQLLMDSRERGNYQITHKQFDSIRTLRSAY
jgi:hypothetical protein